ncbi:hypothetical protein D9Q98_002674 [Chlorella vulgaris]|uniref:Uncharacterized protein n=1 Tax=Chlorella vulgaris TaxID=3077 RepID=A0A9D4TTU9_CHLVU|nr:hypothetical protein D9Q98_002674 [Chlorella vulgaris]
MQSPGKLCLLAVLLAAGCALADDHDCIYGEPPLCQHALASDTTCRGINATTKDAWLSTECDYVLYDVPAKQESNAWIVIHAADCDNWTGELGDYFSEAAGTNLFGLRQCVGLDPQVCTLNRSRCDALHVSWTMPDQPATLGLGFNPPVLVEAAKNTSNQILFIHSYDGLPTYPWSTPCSGNNTSHVCIFGDDPDFDRKFYGDGGIKELLEDALNGSPHLSCPVEVVDARNSSEVPSWVPGPAWPQAYASNRRADLPCSGMFPIGIGNWAWEMQDAVAGALQIAIVKGDDQETLDLVTEAIKVAIS